MAHPRTTRVHARARRAPWPAQRLQEGAALTSESPTPSSAPRRDDSAPRGDDARTPAPSRAVPGIGKAETPDGGPPRPGLREQIGNTKRAATGLLRSHIDLAKAEIGEILDVVKTITLLAGIALAIALFTGHLLYIGGWLFLGEWLFGSIGWGVLHGLLFGAGFLVLLGLLIAGVSATRPIAALFVGLLIGALLALLLGFQVLPRVADSVLGGRTIGLEQVTTLEPRLALLLGGAVVLAVAGLLAGIRSGIGGIIGGLLGGAVAGVIVGLVLARRYDDPGVFVVIAVFGALLALVGLLIGLFAMRSFSAAMFGFIGGAVGGAILGLILGNRYQGHVATAIGLAVALVLWSVLQIVFARNEIGPAISRRAEAFKPTETIETAKETKEWLGQQWANRRSKLGRR